MAVWQAVEEHFHDIARLIVINLCVFRHFCGELITKLHHTAQ
ncbi:MAG: hypothetical protein V3V89_00360 [Gammaproteobacteria bacterium]